MRPAELREEIDIELELLESTVRELTTLRHEVSEREPTVREKTAAGAFLAQFYAGIENILKRVCHFHGIAVPSGDTWHIDLFKYFCKHGYNPLPILFDESLASKIAPFRKFRHVVYHGYGFQLDWTRMKEGIESVEDVYLRFKIRLLEYINEKVKT
ncbi:MAG: hypothetical protein HY884_04720 [Deltaproteobacteria bacterium]|nr:hypothetical protein [Deltaproteobacteria bacterium]